MTLPLRRKRLTTVPVRSTPARMAVSLMGLGLLLAAGPAAAQGPPLTSPPVGWGTLAPVSPRTGDRLPSAPVPVQPREQVYRYSGSPGQSAPVAQPFPPARMPATHPLQLAAVQPKMPDKQRATDEITDYNIQLDVPGNQRLFLLESEASLKERMRQEAKRYGERLVFPDEPILSKLPYSARQWEPLTRLVEPHYVCYGRLLFEQKNFERYGWDLGPITPLVSAGTFYWDVLTLPYNVGTRPCQQYECSAGYCLPGDPVPFLLYPPELSLTGALAEGAAITGLFLAFP